MDFISVAGSQLSTTTTNLERWLRIEDQKEQNHPLKGTHEFWIHPIDVDGYILINDTSSSFEIFFCLRNPPTYFIEKEIAPFDFNTRSFNLYIRRNCPVSSSDSWTIRDELQYFALAVYNVCNLKLDTSDYGPILDTIEIKKSERFKREYLIKAWQSKYAAVLPPVVPKNVLLKFQKCSSIATLEILLDNTVPVRFNPLHVQSMKEVDLPFAECDPPYELFGARGGLLHSARNSIIFVNVVYRGDCRKLVAPMAILPNYLMRSNSIQKDTISLFRNPVHQKS